MVRYARPSILTVSFAGLSRVLESDRVSAEEIHKVVSSIYLARRKDALEDAQRIASKRSGARGAEARKRLLDAEAAMAAEEARALGGPT